MSARRTAGVVAGVLAVGAVATAVTVFNLPDTPSSSAATGSTGTKTTEISKETLVDRESHDGSLGHGSTSVLAAGSNGTVTWLPTAGATIARGKALYRLDNKPVVLLYGTLPAYRTLAPGVKGPDVKQLEKNLWALGYRGFTVDSTYSSATADAVEEWQDDLGLTETGRVESSQIVYAATAVRVDSVTVQNGSAAMAGTELLKYTGTTLVATVDLGMDSQRLAKQGVPVQVEMPDGKKLPGKIIKLGTTVQAGQGDEPDTTLIEVTVGFAGSPAGMDEASVTVYFTSSERKDVLTVPVAALLALAEGGYGVQVVDGATTKIVAVETGLFADGKVEITGDGLAAGMKVGIPV
ncbi:peptidoglycan-binding protein [Paractinoplanes durhamensis]|uniref:Peptidoglycan-binding protein n=1 Tax=Paractinoplanes durhamensis TaxID=113563 RepID=A0ABQ3YZ69_9ACTN|nr:peptidoglycan-binding protein [Actinoplanes durhamensis]GIE02884.1 peptidoglycan-binding protein [Actinoplanes durhamensis]